MKLKQGFITHETGDEQIMVAAGEVNFAGLVRSNRTAAFIVDCLKQEISQEQLVDAVEQRYDAPRAVIARDVAAILETLRGIGALDE
jgi:hypothetical protein